MLFSGTHNGYESEDIECDDDDDQAEPVSNRQQHSSWLFGLFQSAWSLVSYSMQSSRVCSMSYCCASICQALLFCNVFIAVCSEVYSDDSDACLPQEKED